MASRVDDFFFAAKQQAIIIDGNQKRVNAVGDVRDEPDRKADERAIVVDGGVELPVARKKPAGEHKVADAGVTEAD